MFTFALTINNDLKKKAGKLGVIAADLGAAYLRWWQENILPGHFKTSAARKYGYQRRTSKYQKRKRKKGSPPALVFSGKARDRLTRPSFFQAKRIGKAAKGKFLIGSDLRYFYMQARSKKGRLHPNKPAELTSFISREEQEMVDAIRDGVIRELEKPTPAKVLK